MLQMFRYNTNVCKSSQSVLNMYFITNSSFLKYLVRGVGYEVLLMLKVTTLLVPQIIINSHIKFDFYILKTSMSYKILG